MAQYIATPDSTDGFKVGNSSSSLVGFWGVTPVDQPAALTAQVTTLTHAAPGTPDYTIAALTTTTPAGFASIDEGTTVVACVRNLQIRVAEIEARLEEAGIIAAN
jgi:hypothetical protein